VVQEGSTETILQAFAQPFSRYHPMQHNQRFTEPAVDFSDALHVIRDYHTHFLALCERLARLVEQIELQAISGDFGMHARQLRHEFVTAFALHHHDEEHTLFPCVKHSSRQALDEILQQLETEHLEIDLVWSWLTPLLQDTGQVRDYSQFSHALRQFVQLLQRHIDNEEQTLLPVIEQLLTPDQRQRIGASMQRDRLTGIVW
jgi:hemerythrin-like domain-containing protein